MKLFKITSMLLALSFASSSLFGLEVNIYKTKDWGEGFCAKVLIYNDSKKSEQWDILFQPNGQITKLWNANYQQDPDTFSTHVKGLKWNKIIKAKHSRSFGYCANAKAPKILTIMPKEL